MSVYIAPPFVWVVASVTVGYLAVTGYLMNYLSRAHPDIWTELGSPSIIPTALYAVPTFKLIFGSRHRAIADTKLSSIIWSIRVLMLIALGLIGFGSAFGLF